MKRKLFSVLIGLALPAWVFALGLGNLELNSGLNQPFDAKIELLSVTADELAGLNISLADSEAFQRAGIDRPFLLGQLKFTVDAEGEGPAYVRVTSSEAIREPFLNFLIEANWAKGRLYREYTVLLDPPLYDPNARRSQRIEPVDTPSSHQDDYADSDYQTEEPEVAESYEYSEPVSSDADYSGSDYGPTTVNDTLWSIAQRMRPDSSVSIQQMMLALLRANPEAFLDNNINGLKRGQILRMPAREDINVLSEAEAISEAKAQYSLWQDARGTLASSVSERAESAAVVDDYDAAAYETADTSDDSDSTGELRLVAGAEDDSGLTQDTGDSGENLALANEQLEALSQENADLRSRTAEAEAIIEDLKRLIALKDDELAAMQQQLSGASAPEEVELAEEAEEEYLADTEEIMGPEEDFSQLDEEEVIDEDVSQAEFDEDSSAVVEEEAEEAEAEAEVEETLEEEQTPAVEEDYEVPAPSGIVDQALDFVMSNLIMLAGGLAGLLVLVAAAIFIKKRKGQSDEVEELPEAAPTEFPDFSETSDDVAEAPAAEAPVDSEAETALHEEAGEGEAEAEEPEPVAEEPAPEPEEPEEDPLAEVNVFLAYEHFEQAEEFVRDAIAEQPENLDFHSKLLEVFYASGNKKAYEEEAQVLNGLVNGEGAHWDMALAMWAEMSPNRALFAEPVAGEEEEAADTGGGGIVDLTADEDAAPADPGLDFDLGTEGADAEQPAAAAPDSPDEDVLDITAGGDDEGVLDVTAASGGEEDILDVTAAINTDGELAGEDLLDVTAAVGLDTEAEQADAAPAAAEDTAEEDVLDITGGASAEEELLDITGGGAAEEDDLLDVTGHTDLGGADLEEDLLDVTSATSAGADADALLEVPEESAADEPAAEDDNALDFDIGGVEAESEPEALDVEAESTDNVIDFDSGSAAPEQAESDGDDGGLDFDIGGVDESPEVELDIEADSGDGGLSLDSEDSGDDGLEIDLSVGDEEEDAGLDLDIEVPESSGDEISIDSVADDDGLEIDLSESDDDISLDIGDAAEDDGGAEIDLTIGDDAGADDSLEISLDEALEVPEIEDDLSIDLEIDAKDDTPSIEVDMDGTVEMPKIDLEESASDEDVLDFGIDEDDEDDDDDDDEDHTVFVPRAAAASEQSADDEIATKLDLAKAYVELGDKDSAKSILDEVVADGNDEQRQQAQDLLNQV